MMSLIDISLLLALAGTGVGLILVFVRLVRGPSLPDRVVALDMVSFIAIAISALLALYLQQPVLLDVAVVLALISFLATIAFARYVAAGHQPDNGDRA